MTEVTMDMNIVVGLLIAAVVVTDVAYLVRQRRRGIHSCGCAGCSGCRPKSAINVTFDEGDGRDRATMPGVRTAPFISNSQDLSDMKYRCPLCGYTYDEEKEGVKFADLPDDWCCPVCGEPKSEFTLVEE